MSLIVSGTLLASNSTLVAAQEEILPSNDSLSTKESIQASTPSVQLPAQVAPAAAVVPTGAEPAVRFSNSRAATLSTSAQLPKPGSIKNNTLATSASAQTLVAQLEQSSEPAADSAASEELAETSAVTRLEQSSEPAADLAASEDLAETVTPATDETVAADENVTAQAEGTSAQDLIIPTRFNASLSTSSAGFDEIVGVGAFVPLSQTAGEAVTFLEGDLQLIEGDPSISLSLGHRGYNAERNLVRGGYVGVDSRSTEDNTFYQLAAGYERLGEDWDFRFNGYVPIGDRTNTLQNVDTDTGLQTSSGFQGNQLVLSAVRERQRIFQQENALGGFDAEIGTSLFDWNSGELMGYAGGYLLSGEDSSLGGQLRLAANFESKFNAGLSLQHDDLFGTSVALSFNASWPSFRFHEEEAADFQEEYEVPIRLRDPITRRSSVAVNVRDESEIISEEDVEALRNPEEEEDYRFIHVDLASSGGDGTYENPFGSVEDAIALINSDADTFSDGNTIVYVNGENATASIPGFTIPEHLNALGE
ncbi:MAG: hypothetical protein F6J97_22355, partial [Leptolyngbya sp. SIO4C1]|nr:hypothetical protein [Leptolyngbya sp. SIO4C1]